MKLWLAKYLPWLAVGMLVLMLANGVSTAPNLARGNLAGSTGVDWVFTFLPGLGGITAAIGAFFAKRSSGQNQEILVSLLAWLANRNDPVAFRRFFLAVLDALRSHFADSPEVQTWVKTGRQLELETMGPALASKANQPAF